MSAVGGILQFLGAGIGGVIDMDTQRGVNESNERIAQNTNSVNAAMQYETNKTNRQIAEDTNATNREIAEKTNEFNAAQADKAYERSTASSKVAELIAAGMSPQQARLVVATNGLTGTATPATGVAATATTGAPMEAPKNMPWQQQAYQGWGSNLANGLGALGQGIDSMTNTYLSSFTAPDGGFVGAYFANDVFDSCSSRIGEIPANVLSSPHSFQLWLSMQKDGYWHDLASSDKFKKMWSHPLGRRSFLYQLTQTYAESASVENSLALQQLAIKRQNLGVINDNLQNKYTDLQITSLYKDVEAQDIENQRNRIVLERDKATAELVTNAEIASLKLSISDDTLRERLLSDPVYCDIWLKSQLSNQAMGLAMNSYVAMMYEGRNTWLKEHPQDASALAVFSMFDELGFSNLPLFRDLQENYVAGGSFGTYIAREYSNPKNRGWFKGMYDYNLKHLWQWRADAGFDANFEPWLWQQGSNLVSGVLDKGVGLLEDYVVIQTAGSQNRTFQMDMERTRHENRMAEIRERENSYHRSRPGSRSRRRR